MCSDRFEDKYNLDYILFMQYMVLNEWNNGTHTDYWVLKIYLKFEGEQDIVNLRLLPMKFMILFKNYFKRQLKILLVPVKMMEL